MIKVKKGFIGDCYLAQLQKGEYFRLIDKSGKISKETYTKDDYDFSAKKYLCLKHSDIWGSGVLLKGSRKITTDFIY